MAATEFENISRNVRFPQMVYHCNPHDRGKCNSDVVAHWQCAQLLTDGLHCVSRFETQ